MSYANIVKGQRKRFLTVNGLTAESVLDYEPRAIQHSPTLYSVLDSFERGLPEGNVVVVKYRRRHRLCIRWQDHEQAEKELEPFVNSIPAAIDADPYLDGLVEQISVVTDGQAEYREISGVVYRTLDFYSEAFEKGAYQGGI